MIGFLVFYAAVASAPLASQAPNNNVVSPAVVVATTLPTVEALKPCCVIPALTPVELEITQAIDSKTAKIGDMFSLKLLVPIQINGRTIVPAGVTGEGEVIDVHKSGWGGKAGSLTLAGRYLSFQSQKMTLRSFIVGSVGKDNTNLALAINIAAGPLGVFITGKSAVIPAGIHAAAKIREDVVVTVAKSAPSLLPTQTSPLPTISHLNQGAIK